MRRTDEQTHVFSREVDLFGTANFFIKGTVSILARLLAAERFEGYDTITEEPGNQTHFDYHCYHD